MKQICTLFILFLSLTIYGQDLKFTDQEIEIKLDSIKAEGNLLYSLENSSWHSNDIARSHPDLKDSLGLYLTYKANNIVKTVFLNKAGKKVIAEYSFLDDSKIPSDQNLTERNLNATEIDLKNVRQNLLPQLADEKYEVLVAKGYSLNIITIPFGENFKTYLIPGTSKTGIIPFGNDFLFVTDKNGKILMNKKFHSRLIPTAVFDEPDKKMVMATHSHLDTNPLISATDICTFKLYAPFINLDKFSVYSPGMKMYFEYSLEGDSLKAKSSMK